MKVTKKVMMKVMMKGLSHGGYDLHPFDVETHRNRVRGER